LWPRNWKPASVNLRPPLLEVTFSCLTSLKSKGGGEEEIKKRKKKKGKKKRKGKKKKKENQNQLPWNEVLCTRASPFLLNLDSQNLTAIRHFSLIASSGPASLAVLAAPKRNRLQRLLLPIHGPRVVGKEKQEGSTSWLMVDYR
jgi:hypothetical protein